MAEINGILDQAVERGILDAGQRSAVLSLAAEIDRPKPLAIESVDEQMRLVGGGNDLFVTVGILLLFSGALFALNALMPGNWTAIASMVLAGIIVVAEIVTRQHRMRLSSTVLGLVESFGLKPQKIAVERNLEIVPRSAYGEVALAEGDRIEIVNFVGGG